MYTATSTIRLAKPLYFYCVTKKIRFYYNTQISLINIIFNNLLVNHNQNYILLIKIVFPFLKFKVLNLYALIFYVLFIIKINVCGLN